MENLRLSAIEIASLGDLRDVKLQDLSPALNIVYGPNESGKSTVRDAVRYAIFGFPGTAKGIGGAEDRKYLDGPRDVALTFAGSTGRVTLRRDEFERKQTEGREVITPAHGAAVVGELRRDISALHFHSMWNVTTENMPVVNPGKSGDVAVISSLLAALHGTRVSPDVAADSLTSAADTIWGGKNAKDLHSLKALIARVREVDERIRQGERDAQDAIVAYQESADAQVQVDELDRTIAEQQGALSDIRARRADTDHALERLSDALRGLDRERAQMESLNDLAALAAEPTTVALAAARSSIDELVYQRGTVDGDRSRLRELGVSAAALESQLTYYEGVPAIMVGADLAKHVQQVNGLSMRIATQKEILADLPPLGTPVALPDSLRKARGWSASRRLATSVLVGLPVALITIFGSTLLYALPLPYALAIGFGLGVIAAVASWMVAPRPLVGSPADIAADIAPDATRHAAERRLSEALASLSGYLRAFPELADLDGRDPGEIELLVSRAHERAQVAGELDRVRAETATLTQSVAAWDSACRDRIATLPVAPGLFAANIAELDSAAREGAAAIEAAAQAESRRALTSQAVARFETAMTEARANLAAAAAAIGVDGSALELVGGDDADRSIERATQVAIAISSALGARMEVLAVAMRELEGQRRDAATRQGQLTERYNNALGNEDLEDRRAEREALTGDIEVLAERYAVTKLAADLITRAHTTFGGDRGPKILEQASAIFNVMTEGNYVAVRSEGDDITRAIYAERADGFKRLPSEMSTGTVEQLYLAIRIGALLALPDTGTDLPILLDDVLVNFDPKSRAQTVRALAQLSATRQIIFFTCHPETADLINEAGLAANIPTSRAELDARRPNK